MMKSSALDLFIRLSLFLAPHCLALTPQDVSALIRGCGDRILGMNVTAPDFPIEGEDLRWANIKGHKMALWSTPTKQRLLIQGPTTLSLVAEGNETLINEYLRQLEREYRPQSAYRKPYQNFPYWTAVELLETKEGPAFKIKIHGTAPEGFDNVLASWKSKGENPIFYSYKGNGIYEVALPSTLNKRLGLTETAPIFFVPHQQDRIERSEYQKYLVLGKIPISMRDHFMHDAAGHAEVMYRFAMVHSEKWNSFKSTMGALISKGNQSEAKALLDELSDTYENEINKVASKLRDRGYLDLVPLSSGLDRVIRKAQKFLVP